MLRALLLSSLLAQEPLAKARSLLEENRIEEAIVLLERAVSEAPDSPEALWMAAVAYLRLGRFAEGLPHATALHRVTAGDPRAALVLASYCEAVDDSERALSLYDQVLEREPRNPEALYRASLLRRSRGDLEAAARGFETLLVDHPGDPRSLVPLGAIRAQQRRPIEAIDRLTAALEREERSAEAHHYLGAVYSELGLWEEAERHLARALEIHPDNPASLFETGLLFARKEERERALEYFRRARDRNPDDPQVSFRIAEILRYQKSFTEAERLLRDVVARAPELHEARLELGLLLLEAARHQEAEATLRELVEARPESAEAHHRLALACAKTGKGDEARLHFERSIALAPEAQETHLHYGNFLMQQGERTSGEKHLVRFQELKRGDDRAKALSARVELEPSNLELKRELVRHLVDLGRREDAARQAERFLALDPANPDLRLLRDETAK